MVCVRTLLAAVCLFAAADLASSFAVSPSAAPLRSLSLSPSGSLAAPPLRRTAAASLSAAGMQSQDTHVQLMPFITVPEGKMGEFKQEWPEFYKSTRAGTENALYYGFAVCDNKVFCREGYKNAEGVLAHLGEVDAPLNRALDIAGGGSALEMSVAGPKAELDKLREALTPLGCSFYECDPGSMWFKGGSPGQRDTHVTIFPIFTVQPGRMDEFKKGFADFYKATREGTKETLYYGFSVCGDKVYCREGYESASGALAHLGDVDAPLNAALSMASVDLSVMGPAAELEKLKEAMAPLGTKFYALDEGAFWK